MTDALRHGDQKAANFLPRKKAGELRAWIPLDAARRVRSEMPAMCAARLEQFAEPFLAVIKSTLSGGS